MLNRVMLAILVSVVPLPAVAHCVDASYTTEDAPDFLIRNRLVGRSVSTELDVLQHGVPWAADFGRGRSGVYLSYKLDSDATVYLAPSGNKLAIATPELKKGIHTVTLELWSSHQLFQRKTYCIQVPK